MSVWGELCADLSGLQSVVQIRLHYVMWQPEKPADYVTWDSALERGCLEKVENQNFF